MRLPRVQFTIGALMVAVAVTAVVMSVAVRLPRGGWIIGVLAVLAVVVGLPVGLRRRAERFKRLSFLHSVDANRWENVWDGSLDDALAGAILRQAHWHDAMVGKYGRVARSPWRLLEPPPPKPRIPHLPTTVAARYKRGRYPFPPPA